MPQQKEGWACCLVSTVLRWLVKGREILDPFPFSGSLHGLAGARCRAAALGATSANSWQDWFLCGVSRQDSDCFWKTGASELRILDFGVRGFILLRLPY